LLLIPNLHPEDNEEEVTLSLEKAQMYAFSFIPWDATVEEARGWLLGQIDRRRHGLTTADLGFICRVHAEDKLVQAWRVNETSHAINIAPLN
jgi:hypothetical protein